MKATISTCIIVKNEIKNIPGLISDLRQFSEEIIVVDTGSTDGTLEWLKEHEDDVLKVDNFVWVDHFAEARNYSFSKASQDWIFWCDADDRISPELIDEIINLKQTINDTDYTSVFINYAFTATHDVPRRRLLKRSMNPTWYGACHEYVMCSVDKTTKIDDSAKIIHKREHVHTDRNLGIFIQNILDGKQLNHRDMTYYSNELRDAGFKLKSGDIAEIAILMPGEWRVDAWNLMMFNAAAKWMLNPENAKRGLTVIDEFNKKSILRSDVYWLRGHLNKIVGNMDEAINDWKRSLDGDGSLEGLDLYNRLDIYSKIYPAINLYNNSPNDRDRCLEVLSQFKDNDAVKKFYLEQGIS